jgi:adenine-specific DNA-methyltransferase
VYGCFLKNFKAKALKALLMKPIHTCATPASASSSISNKNVLDASYLESLSVDAVYLDPPYNERQYSKNYFPLNIIADVPSRELTVGGVTGIPSGCFISPFCKRGKVVEIAFTTLFESLRTEYIFLSYNSESLISKDRMCELMSKYGTVSVVEREYKRFKSFEYNTDAEIKEYLFCLKRSTAGTGARIEHV